MSRMISALRVTAEARTATDEYTSIKAVGHRPGGVAEGLKKDYVCPAEMNSRPRRASHCLAWSAKNYPGEFVEWRCTYCAIFGIGRATSGSKEVVSLSKCASRIREILDSKYGLMLIVEAGIGARATYNADDAAGSGLDKASKKIISSIRSFVAAVNLVDPSKMTNESLKTWVISSHRKSKLLVETTKGLLAPPKPVEDVLNKNDEDDKKDEDDDKSK
jgi:hypothetical protein